MEGKTFRIRSPKGWEHLFGNIDNDVLYTATFADAEEWYAVEDNPSEYTESKLGIYCNSEDILAVEEEYERLLFEASKVA